MEISTAVKVKGVPRSAMNFGGYTGSPIRDPFEVFDPHQLVYLSPMKPSKYYWVEITTSDGKTKYYYSDNSKWYTAKDRKEAEKKSGLEEGKKEFIERAERQRAQHDQDLKMQQGGLTRAWAVSSDAEKAALAAEIMKTLKTEGDAVNPLGDK